MTRNSYGLSYFRFGPSNIETLPCCRRYIDDTITTVHKCKIDEFHRHWSKRNTSNQLAKEIEDTVRLSSYQDCLITRANNTQRTTVYRKPTYWQTTWPNGLQSYFSHTKRLLYESCQEEHKCLRLTRQFHRRKKHLNAVLIKNNCSTDFVECNTYVRLNDSSSNSFTTATTISYIQGRILKTQFKHHLTAPSGLRCHLKIRNRLTWFADNLAIWEQKLTNNYSRSSQAKRLLITWESQKKSLPWSTSKV